LKSTVINGIKETLNDNEAVRLHKQLKKVELMTGVEHSLAAAL